jgi:hypothetical protein
MNEAERLRGEADQLDAEATELAEQAKAFRVEAARLRARAERHDEPEKAIRVLHTALARARGDGLLAAAGVACGELDAPFTAGDLAAHLGIDEARGMRLLLAVAELGHVVRTPSGGWMVDDPVLREVRDYVAGAGTFTIGDVVTALDHGELDVADALTELRDRGVIEGGGGHYRYVEVVGTSPAREDRRPPEKEPPAGSDSRAQGKAVRVVNHGKRGQQMQGGNRRHVIRRDQNRERAEAARQAKEAARAAARADDARQTKVRR